MTPENIAGMAYINGLDAVALTDHNSCKNCEAFLEATKKHGVLGICGMELTTAEEIHVLWLFESLEAAMRFDAFVEEHLLKVKNQIRIYGNQLLYGPGDRCLGEYDNLLIAGTDLSFEKMPQIWKEYGGIYLPAHINKPTTSLLSSFGMIPPDSEFTIYELNRPADKEQLCKEHPYLRGKKYLSDSDAHRLIEMRTEDNAYVLEVEEKSFEGIKRSLLL
ncbi:hypothetical protein SAMN02910417_01814 [Eubacterium oxidoreducens]|uniref:PHP domain-containing protein n=2 Tax=Eubacterium oxidoreducens TaxID=1732 RepID=A0A1G6BVH4_EUBOX|nr:hypothetical protein SAMN02910417_01814 [Eubacterium oxidoreducens]